MEQSFHCRHGKAYLFNHATNISVGDEEERVLFSGMHTVADIFCCCCGQNVGWKYVVAQEKTQKYKEGKFVLERGRIADGTDLEFYVDTRPSGSDADDS
ncbi:hypothetical protein C4D60_Mb04t39710 [Musa balbisiana]|uniref:Protein yippee-like n=1 Tax=Musa balbisiana TaxID=52838 RepID=A0A4S8KI53_MUSBA|nr:hypothetical protein C4D60_Mb04t39710 [Musa balbisiana]